MYCRSNVRHPARFPSRLILRSILLSALLIGNGAGVIAQEEEVTEIVGPPAVFNYTPADYPFMAIDDQGEKAMISFHGEAAHSTAEVVERAILLTPVQAVMDEKGAVAGLSLTAIPGFLADVLKSGDIISQVDGISVSSFGVDIDDTCELANLGNTLALDLQSNFFTVVRVDPETGAVSQKFILFEAPL